MATDKIMKILYHHRTASKDGQAVHIEEMIDAMRSLGHEVRVVAPTLGAPADQQGAMGGDNARRVVALALSVHG